MARDMTDTMTALERMFDRPFAMQAWTPSLELFQKEDRLIARVEVPGLKKEQITIEVADGRLTVRGERRREEEVRQAHAVRSEREYGTFSRSFTLPEGVRPEAITATMTEGVLEIVVPLPVKAAPMVATVPIEDRPRAA